MPEVLLLGSADSPLPQALAGLLAAQGLELRYLADHSPIPGSYWGESEAGLLGHVLLVRPDTPVHSALHEACHYLCADAARRATLHTDAGGDDLEECAVCYLSILLADALPGYEATAWNGILAPAGTPKPVIERLHREITKIVRSPEFSQQLTGEGATAVGNTPAEFAALIQADIRKWAEVVKEAGIQRE